MGKFLDWFLGRKPIPIENRRFATPNDIGKTLLIRMPRRITRYGIIFSDPLEVVIDSFSSDMKYLKTNGGTWLPSKSFEILDEISGTIPPTNT